MSLKQIGASVIARTYLGDRREFAYINFEYLNFIIIR